jgi:hypothetical protein
MMLSQTRTNTSTPTTFAYNITSVLLPRPGRELFRSSPHESIYDEQQPQQQHDERSGRYRRIGRRKLKQQPPPFCDDFRFEFAIDGVVTSWDKDEFEGRRAGIQRVVEVVKFSEGDPNRTSAVGREVELAFRLTGCGIVKQFQLTHVYWA